jgi:peroxiredoxin
MKLGAFLAPVAVLFVAAGARADQPVTLNTPAPELQEVQWLGTKPLAWKDLRGQVVVLHFWTFGCINCIHNYPSYRSWNETYSKKGVTLLGVHTPETKGEADLESVKKKIKENRLIWPMAVDGKSKTWEAWGNRYWPATYLIDKKGQVRYLWEGELNYNGVKGEEIMRRKIEELLAEKD